MTTTPTVYRLASRLDNIGFSDIVNIRNRIMRLREQGATVYQFEGGEPYMLALVRAIRRLRRFHRFGNKTAGELWLRP